MAEGVLFSVAEGILGKLGSFALQEIGLWWGLKDEIELLNITILGVQKVLLDAEEQQARGDERVKAWLYKLKEVLYDADDLLDDFSTEVLRRKVMIGNKVAKEVRLFFSSSNQVAYGLKMGHKIKAIKERLDAVMRVGNHFNFQQRLVDPSVLAKRRDQSHSTVPEVVVGREDDKKAIKQLLLSTNYETNVSVISIVGIGGLGKTTLAQLAYNDDDLKLHFELTMWVCVSDDFSTKLIIEKILESLTGKKPEMGEMNTLKDSLNEKITGKKYLLVLDDVWNDDSEKWYHLRDLLVGGARGSRILVTTRSEKVARITSPVPQAQYVLKGLSEKESWSLFIRMAFEQGCATPTSSHEVIGKEIVAKCKGVPLAIRAIGRLLYFKETLLDWESFKNKELASVDQGESGILAALKLSYDLLPSHLKHCFAYCRLFPKDHEIDVKMLVALWMAQGFVKLSDPSQSLEDIALEYFMDLLWRSFFQEVRKDELGNIKNCKMHDLMHDLASLVAGDESAYVSISNLRRVGEKTRHISFHHLSNEYSDSLQVPIFMLEAKSLRTFLVLDTYSNGTIGEGQCQVIFSNFKRLRQLDLRDLDIEIVPHSIDKLKHLRYLNMSWNRKIKMLPPSITKLQNLQVLNLNHCGGLRQLPKDIKKLVSLSQLELVGCDDLTHMPQGIGQLTSLERLTHFRLPKNSKKKKESESGGLSELHGLNKLGGNLSIENLPHGNGKYNQKSTVAETAADANLSEKPRLQYLDIVWVSFEDSDSNAIDDDDDEMTLEALRPHPNLKQLTLRNYRGMKFASWLSSLTNLVSLQLYDCRKCQSLPALDQFPSLKDLVISGLPDLEYIDIESCVVGGGCSSSSSSSSSMVSFFPSLEILRFYDCPNLKGWRPSPSSSSSSSSLLPQFQRLSLLYVWSCPNLTSMPPFPSLKRLRMESASFKSLEQMLKATISPAHTPSSSLPSNLSSLTSLYIENIEHLPEDFLPMELIQTLTSLEDLIIALCPKLICLPHEKTLHLSSLKHLEICDCKDLDLSNYDDDDDDDDSDRNTDAMLLQDLRSLTSLAIDGIPKLEHLPKRLLLHSVVLQSLSISHCNNLASLPDWMPNITSLQRLYIWDCSQVSERCKNNMGEDWPKIAHIPHIEIQGTEIQRNGCYKL